MVNNCKRRSTVRRINPSFVGCRQCTLEVAIQAFCCSIILVNSVVGDTQLSLFFNAKIVAQ